MNGPVSRYKILIEISREMYVFYMINNNIIIVLQWLEWLQVGIYM